MKSNNNIQSETVNIGIYEMTNNINGKKYFGQTIKPIKKRFKRHCKSPYPIGCAIRKYGPKNFSIKMIIKNIDSQEAANDIEKHLIREFNTLACNGNGYNIAEGGYGNPLAGMSEEKKREISIKKSKAYHNKNDEWKKERNRKISEKQKGTALYVYQDGSKVRLPIDHHDVLNGLVVANSKGKKVSDEARKKQSESMKGKTPHHKFNPNSLPQEVHSTIIEMRSNGISLTKISLFLLETFNHKCSRSTIGRYF